MKISEQKLLEFRIELEELITEREGMIVCNKEREMNGESLAYPEERFIELEEKIRNLRKALTSLVEKYGG